MQSAGPESETIVYGGTKMERFVCVKREAQSNVTIASPPSEMTASMIMS